jgi:hypothetical protein
MLKVSGGIMSQAKLRRRGGGISVRTDKLFEHVAPEIERVRGHALYGQIQSVADVRVFMEHHVFAVWDFMSLVKALQSRLTSVAPPWRPVGDGMVRRFINELVLEEESDHVNGRYISHMEMYIEGMQQAGANTARIMDLMHQATERGFHHVDLGDYGAAGHFVQRTWRHLESESLPVLVGAFTIGRENMIPTMFNEIVVSLAQTDPEKLTIFRSYLDRHIELDGGSHGEMACRLLETVCGDDEEAWTEAARAGTEAIRARLLLWDAVSSRLSADTQQGL